MTCVFIIAALKQEAELYLAQGLYQEALDLYGGYLERVPDLEPGMRRSLEAAMAQIRAMINDLSNDDEDQLLDDAGLTRIRQGWRGPATCNDLLVSAQALRHLGRFSEALEEYRLLLADSRPTREIVAGVTDCLVHLTDAQQFCGAIQQFLGTRFQLPKTSLLFKLLMARMLDVQHHPRHYRALVAHLARAEAVPPELQPYIQALEEQLPDRRDPPAEDDAYGPVDGLNFHYGAWTRNE